MILEVDRQAKGPQVILTRSHSDFLRRLFESEVPEIAEKIVEIRSISREPGSRAKVAVFSHDDRVDAVGACVGVKGSRVQNIVRELGGERIDIVPWSSDPALFVTRALSPAKIQRVEVHEDRGSVTVVVPEDQLSLAIGKGGQNVRLAMKLTGWNVELVSDAQAAEERAVEELADFDLEEISDRIGPKLTERLIQAGLETASDVMASSAKALQEIDGVGPKSAEKVIQVVSEHYRERVAELHKQGAAAAMADRAPAIGDDPESEGDVPADGSPEPAKAGRSAVPGAAGVVDTDTPSTSAGDEAPEAGSPEVEESIETQHAGERDHRERA
jgi:N utilization substance protein A